MINRPIDVKPSWVSDGRQFAFKAAAAYVSDNPLAGDLHDKVMGYIRARDHVRLSSCTSLLPEFHGESFVRLRQVEAFFKKHDAFADEASCTEAARINFKRAEKRCRIVNKRLDYYYVQRERLAPDLVLYMSKMEQSINRLLGDYNSFLDKLPSLIRVTAGATEDRSRKRAVPFLKISGRVRAPKASHSLLETLGAWFGHPDLRCTNVTSNRVTLVPKNWKTHRTIACEPTGSLPLQLAFDEWAKSRLNRVGIRLTSQERNQEMARVASLTGDHATLDLEMASDSLAFNAVAWLLPSDWFNYLCAIRSRSYSGVFGCGDYAKFSSMGNGATFTLETIVFWAACKAVGCSDFTVYGDDIVVETEFAAPLKRVLSFLGFLVNREKTYESGPFRESCGTDWLSGQLVTPWYLRQHPKAKAGWNHIVNGLASLGHPDGELWKLCLEVLKFQNGGLLVPFNGDSMSGVWIDVHTSYAKKLIRRKHGISYVRCYAASSTVRTNRGWRSLLLWHFAKATRVSPHKRLADVYEARVSSEVSTGFERYAVTRVRFSPAEVRTPIHLYTWSDWIVGQLDRYKAQQVRAGGRRKKRRP